MAQRFQFPGRRAQRIHAGAEQHVGRQTKQNRAERQTHLLARAVHETPAKEIEKQYAYASQHSVSQGRHSVPRSRGGTNLWMSERETAATQRAPEPVRIADRHVFAPCPTMCMRMNAAQVHTAI